MQFTSETTALLKSIMPLHVEPATPVFNNVDGEPIEPKVFSAHWYNCLRTLGIRTRGLYCTKDTFCSLAVTRGVNPSWLEQQTGVAWATLKKHYAKYIPDQGRDESEVVIAGRGLPGSPPPPAARKWSWMERRHHAPVVRHVARSRERSPHHLVSPSGTFELPEGPSRKAAFGEAEVIVSVKLPELPPKPSTTMM